MNDIIAEGLRGGWDHVSASQLKDGQILEADVVVIGTGAGGATSAEFLSRKGLKVLLVEEGKFYHQKDFKMDQLDAVSTLYQEGTARKTSDGAITIYQGRNVGGSTTVNWTSTFRTPDNTLRHWQTEHGLKGFSPEEMAPWFAEREHALSMSEWQTPPNENNATLKRGCDQLGWSSSTMIRNVKGCWNLGYCGFGCPVNAKQSMLVTSIPKALDTGASLLSCARAERFVFERGRVRELLCRALDENAQRSTTTILRLRARHFVLAAGAIGSPAILLRSDAPDPYGTLGKRTFLHPVNSSTATMPEPVRGYTGAPQSVYSDEFLWKQGVTGPVGFKLEVAPVFPGALSAQETLFGRALNERMAQLEYTQSMIALLRDGFHDASPGGEVKLRNDGSPVLDYSLNTYLWQGIRDAYLRMAELQFAAGAIEIAPVHQDATPLRSWSEAKKAIAELPMKPLRAAIFSAHVMGGCTMGEDARRSVVNSQGAHHQVENLSVIDGSCFPTSIGANPQLSIFGMAAKNASQLAQRLQT